MRRIPWTAIVISVAVLISGGFAVRPVRNAATLADISFAYLERPTSYVAIAPLSNLLDMLTLMSVKQHIAHLLGLIVLFAIALVVRSRFESSTWRSRLIATAVLVAVIAVTYVAVAALPRPMAALVTDDANILKVDFHSHTSASHDGRGGWNAERNRAWHRDAGYDVAYITDHARVDEAERGMARNPNPASEGVTLLQAIEVTWTGEHVAILGAQRTYRGILTENLRDVDVQGLTLASLIGGREPVVIWNHPHQLDRLPVASGPGTAGVRAIEIVNGAPDDMDELRPKRRQIATLAEQRNLALTGGSDNHGWGRATPAWTLMHIPGWRAMHADSLSREIEAGLRAAAFRSTIVVERRVADPEASTLALVLTIVSAPARMLTTLSNEERVAWLIWIWLITTALWWFRRARTPRAS